MQDTLDSSVQTVRKKIINLMVSFFNWLSQYGFYQGYLNSLGQGIANFSMAISEVCISLVFAIAIGNFDWLLKVDNQECKRS